MPNTVLTNARILDGTGDSSFSGEVRIDGNRIQQISNDGSQLSRDDADVIDCAGATLMPGLRGPCSCELR